MNRAEQRTRDQRRRPRAPPVGERAEHQPAEEHLLADRRDHRRDRARGEHVERAAVSADVLHQLPFLAVDVDDLQPQLRDYEEGHEATDDERRRAPPVPRRAQAELGRRHAPDRLRQRHRNADEREILDQGRNIGLPRQELGRVGGGAALGDEHDDGTTDHRDDQAADQRGRAEPRLPAPRCRSRPFVLVRACGDAHGSSSSDAITRTPGRVAEPPSRSSQAASNPARSAPSKSSSKDVPDMERLARAGTRDRERRREQPRSRWRHRPPPRSRRRRAAHPALCARGRRATRRPSCSRRRARSPRRAGVRAPPAPPGRRGSGCSRAASEQLGGVECCERASQLAADQRRAFEPQRLERAGVRGADTVAPVMGHLARSARAASAGVTSTPWCSPTRRASGAARDSRATSVPSASSRMARGGMRGDLAGARCTRPCIRGHRAFRRKRCARIGRRSAKAGASAK